jgi:NAD(P)-dependent dehydrogenase (short-subunit alcohol dehydrogenase family)
MTTIVITGSASGIGAATADLLSGQGHRVIGVDLRDADVAADLGTPAGRAAAVAEIVRLCGGVLDGLVTCAGIGGSTTAPGGRLVSINYFGTVELLEALRPALAAAGQSAVVCLSSNSASCQPNWPTEIADGCLAGDEEQARKVADDHPSVSAYPATKAAIAWYVRSRSHAAEWAGAGIRLNALAPGLIETPLTQAQRRDPVIGPALAAFPVPRGRPGEPEDVAAVIDFMLGPAASLLNGTVLYADGGTDALLRTRDWPARWTLDLP